MLAQLVSYYAAAAPELQLLILDSSRPEVVAHNARMAAQSPNVRHVVFDNSIPMARKLASGMKEVATPTASFCADDDLIFSDGLSEALDFLVAHPDYVSVHGIYVGFRQAGLKVEIAIEYAGPSNEASHPGARLFRLLQKYESLFYGVFRTNDLRDVMAVAGELPTLLFQELFQSEAMVVRGKVKRLSCYYGARRYGPEAEPGRKQWETSFWFVENPTDLLRHYAAYRPVLAKWFGETVPALGHSDVERVIDLSHAVYFARTLSPGYYFSSLQNLWPDDKYVEDADVMRRILPFGLTTVAHFFDRGYRSLRRRISGVQPSRLRAVYLWYEKLGSAPARRLNAKVAGRQRSLWQASFAAGWGRLAGKADFERAYFALCDYLDGGTTGEDRGVEPGQRLLARDAEANDAVAQ